MIGAEFLGMIMLIVYVGAVAVLFLFVVMMLNVAQQKNQWFLSSQSSKHIPIGLIVSLMGNKKMSPFFAGCAATWLHGDIAKNYGKGLIAEDIVKGIPAALRRLKNGRFIK